ncbi:MAG TPA: hypothetical protein VMM13_21300, partial [Euzebya sp.]|nr:hypothetical protein [Euzebya sp.]
MHPEAHLGEAVSDAEALVHRIAGDLLATDLVAAQPTSAAEGWGRGTERSRRTGPATGPSAGGSSST